MAKPWWKTSERPATLCCNDFWHAMSSGTDNEGYGALVHYYGGDFQIGNGMPEVEFCPWCGKKPAAPPGAE